VEVRTITEYLKQDPEWAKILTDMEITEEWLESVGFERNMYSNHAKEIGYYDVWLCIDDNGQYVSLIDDEEGYSVNLRPLNTQEEVRQLYKLLSEEEL